MTICELIKLLNKYPENMRVVIDGYEGGYNDVSNVVEVPIKINQNTVWYYGKHDDCTNDEKDELAIHIN